MIAAVSSKQIQLPGENPANSENKITTHPQSSPSYTSLKDGGTPASSITTPFLHPSSSSIPPTATLLTPVQSAKYNSLLSTVTSWTSLPKPSSPGTHAPTDPLTDSDRIFLTRECLLRYLRATKWSVDTATTRLLATLAWRRAYLLPEHDAAYFSPENATGKQVIFGWDVVARPCLYLNPAQQNTPKSDKQIQHLVFMLERTIEMMGPGQETLSLLINFKEAMGAPKTGQGRQVLNILQSHYPERLGRALVINVPWLFWTFFKLITPFIDPLTREKLKFDQDVRTFVPPEQLLASYGGDVNFIYDHKVYWPAMLALAGARREAYWAQWVRGGKRVGEHEGFLKGAEEVGVGGSGGEKESVGGQAVDGSAGRGEKEGEMEAKI